MRTTLVLSKAIAAEISGASLNSLETAGVLRVTLVEAPNGDIRLLAREIDWVPDEAYFERRPDSLSIASSGYVPSLSIAEANRELAVWFHTHPGKWSSPRPSEHDEIVDKKIADLFRLRTDQSFYATLIVSPRESGFAFTGTLQHEDGSRVPIDHIWVVSDSWHLIASYDAPSQLPPAMYDRSVRAYGGGVQRTLESLRIGIVGLGGTGSSVAEQLVRLGVRHLCLVDNDELSLSNVTRVYGSNPSQVGMLKVDVARHHLTAIAPDLKCYAKRGMITHERLARELISCDVIFGCTDDNAGRLILSRIGTYMMTPVIDMGVLISSNQHERLTGIDGRVSIVQPGNACLLCRNRIDVRRAAAELMVEEERSRLVGEGYAPALGGVEPAVVAFTTAVAAAALAELLERLTGFGDDPRPSEVLLRFHDRDISGNIVEPREGHYCHPASGKIGLGNTSPWLEQTWQIS